MNLIQAVLEIGRQVKDANKIMMVLSLSRKQVGRTRGSVRALMGGFKG